MHTAKSDLACGMTVSTERMICGQKALLTTISDALNRFSNANEAQDTLEILRYIFPRQCGLHNVFTSPVDSRDTAQPFKDYTFRDHETVDQVKREPNASKYRSKNGEFRVPKRLRGRAWNLIRKLQVAHKLCSYTQLLRHYCPLNVCNCCICLSSNTSQHRWSY